MFKRKFRNFSTDVNHALHRKPRFTLQIPNKFNLAGCDMAAFSAPDDWIAIGIPPDSVTHCLQRTYVDKGFCETWLCVEISDRTDITLTDGRDFENESQNQSQDDCVWHGTCEAGLKS